MRTSVDRNRPANPFSISAILLLLSLVPAATGISDALSAMPDSDSAITANRGLSVPAVEIDPIFSDSAFDLAPCIRVGEWVGVLAGSTIGVLHISWRAAGVSGPKGPLYKNVITATPSIIVGAAVGSRMTGWATKKILEGRPSRSTAMFRGAVFGAIDGAVTFTAGLVPLLVLGHYLDTIDFNFGGKLAILKVVGAAVAGGTLYGGVIGAGVGPVYGLTITFCIVP